MEANLTHFFNKPAPHPSPGLEFLSRYADFRGAEVRVSGQKLRGGEGEDAGELLTSVLLALTINSRPQCCGSYLEDFQ